MSWVVAPFDQRYVYPGVPPDTFKSTAPLLPPTELTLVTTEDRLTDDPGWVMVAVAVAVVPTASVTVTT